MPKLLLRSRLTETTPPGKEETSGYVLLGFECGSVGLVSADLASHGRWRLNLAAPGERLRRIPQSFATPRAAADYAQAWLNDRLANVAQAAP
jgi:hypothetical protein